jgi:hypothetical protein
MRTTWKLKPQPSKQATRSATACGLFLETRLLSDMSLSHFQLFLDTVWRERGKNLRNNNNWQENTYSWLCSAHRVHKIDLEVVIEIITVFVEFQSVAAAQASRLEGVV